MHINGYIVTPHGTQPTTLKMQSGINNGQQHPAHILKDALKKSRPKI